MMSNCSKFCSQTRNTCLWHWSSEHFNVISVVDRVFYIDHGKFMNFMINIICAWQCSFGLFNAEVLFWNILGHVCSYVLLLHKIIIVIGGGAILNMCLILPLHFF